MNRLLAILLTLFALLPHPALLAGVCAGGSGGTGEEEVCPPLCGCCAGGECECVQKKETPPLPATPLTVSQSDLFPVPALPPGEALMPAPVEPVAPARMLMPTAADRARTLSLLPLHVRLCVFLN